MTQLSTLLLIIATVLVLLQSINVTSTRVSTGWLGVFFAFLSVLVGRLPIG